MALYLGLWLGPAVAPWASWRAPWAKYLQRARALSELGAQTELAAAMCARRVLTVLSNVGQYQLLLSGMRRKEAAVLASTFKLLCYRVDEQGWPTLEKWGGPRIRGVWCANVAQLVRASLCTFPGWRPLIGSL
eukprot:5586770-Pyramimonas_sp.AAC.1